MLSPRRSPRMRVRPLHFLLIAALPWIVPGALAAQEPEAGVRDGLFITVPNPITDQGLSVIRRKVQTAVDKHRSIEVIVFDFNAHAAPSGTSSFGVCYDLAAYIHNLQLGQVPPLRPRTVAFIRNQVTNHTVLPVLACGEIVMSLEPDEATRTPRARLGDVLFNSVGSLNRQEKLAYTEMAETFASPDLIRRMYEPGLSVARVETDKGVRYLSPQRIARWKDEGRTLAVKAEIPAGLEPGKASFDAEKALEFGLCKALYNTPADLRKALNLSRQSLQEDWFADKQTVAWRIDVAGMLDKGRLDSLRRRIGSAVGHGGNFLILNLDSSAGDTTHVAALAEDLRQLKDKSGAYPIRTVAYLPPRSSLGAATYLALGCNEIVMSSSATLADFNYLRKDAPDLMKRREEMLLPLAREQDYPELLFKATLTPGLALYRVRAVKDQRDERLLTEAEYRADQEGARQWRSLGRLVAAADGELLTIPARRAGEYNISTSTDVDSLEQLYVYCGLQGDQVRVSRDDLLDRVAEFFREPLVNFVLIMVGIIGLIMELKMPGTTFPGAISAICFVLFFWAYSFVGEFTMLAVLLFLLGLILIAVEIFLIPGLGFSGLAGIGLVITSLVLVTLERWPETSQDWGRLGTTMTTLAFSLVGALAGAFVLAWYLPSMPYFSRMVLQPPDDGSPHDGPGSAARADAASLLGAIGAAATPLRPAGKAQFGEAFLDVIAEGDYVNAGSRIQVVEIEGNRIVVKEV